MEFGTVTDFHSVEAPDDLSILGVGTEFDVILEGTKVDVTADGGGLGSESGFEGDAGLGDSLEVGLDEGDVLGVDSSVGVILVNTEEVIGEGDNFNLSRCHDFLGGFVGVESFHELINLFLGDVFGEFEGGGGEEHNGKGDKGFHCVGFFDFFN